MPLPPPFSLHPPSVSFLLLDSYLCHSFYNCFRSITKPHFNILIFGLTPVSTNGVGETGKRLEEDEDERKMWQESLLEPQKK
jgi:hypothetical protein